MAAVTPLDDDTLVCEMFAVEIDLYIEQELAALPPESRSLATYYCRACDELTECVAVLMPSYQQAHKYRRHPDRSWAWERVTRSGGEG